MGKSADAFRTISETAEWLDLPTHVLRFWESKFSQVKPVKRAGGRRYYRPNDMLLLGGIKKLLHEDGMTIKGVQKTLREKGVKYVAGLSEALDGESDETETPETEAAPKPSATVTELKPREATAPTKADAEPTEAERTTDVIAPEATEQQDLSETAEPPAAPEDVAPAGTSAAETEQKPVETPTSPAEDIPTESPTAELQAANTPADQPTDTPSLAEEAPETGAGMPADSSVPDAEKSEPEAATAEEETPKQDPSRLPAFLRRAGDGDTPLEEEAPAPLLSDAPETDPSDTEADVPAGLLSRLITRTAPYPENTATKLHQAAQSLRQLAEK